MNEEEKIEEQLTHNSSKPTENNDIIFEPATINLPTGQAGEQLSTIMEVHKHPHHVTHKKKWKIFAGILQIISNFFCGFSRKLNKKVYFFSLAKKKLPRF